MRIHETCHNCGNDFDRDYLRDKHSFVCHSTRGDRRPRNNGPMTDETCDICRLVFRNREQMMRHRSECIRGFQHDAPVDPARYPSQADVAATRDDLVALLEELA